MAKLTVISMVLLLPASVGCTMAWKKGRATFYGNEPWYWSIHHGSCQYGYQWPDQGTGWDIAALSDAHPDYRGSCGTCYEIKCDSAGIRDGYGEYIDRKGACRNEGESVVVKISDTCPCSYPSNYYSNKRWCCGDMDHFDVSVWAFQKLADMGQGVIPIEYRKVDCSYQPSRAAYLDYEDMFPGGYPPTEQADDRNLDWDRYFPNGGFMNSKAGDGSDKVSVSEFLRRTGDSSSSSSSSTSSSSTRSSSSSSSTSSSRSSTSSRSSSSSSRSYGGRVPVTVVTRSSSRSNRFASGK